MFSSEKHPPKHIVTYQACRYHLSCPPQEANTPEFVQERLNEVLVDTMQPHGQPPSHVDQA